ncbi:MAG: hypothetical protein ABMA13_11635 [Chthoniobacteraceae bacterium]
MTTDEPPPVPRRERAAAALLLVAYSPLWISLFVDGNTPGALFRDIGTRIPGIVLQLLRDPSGIGGVHRTNFIGGLMLGLITASIVLAGQGIIRATGRQGFLRGRSFWWWVAGHGAGGTFFYAALVNAIERFIKGFSMELTDYLFLAGHILPLCIAIAVLRGSGGKARVV